jgi:hypothetical protein
MKVCGIYHHFNKYLFTNDGDLALSPVQLNWLTGDGWVCATPSGSDKFDCDLFYKRVMPSASLLLKRSNRDWIDAEGIICL